MVEGPGRAPAEVVAVPVIDVVGGIPSAGGSVDAAGSVDSGEGGSPGADSELTTGASMTSAVDAEPAWNFPVRVVAVTSADTAPLVAEQPTAMAAIRSTDDHRRTR